MTTPATERHDFSADSDCDPSPSDDPQHQLRPKRRRIRDLLEYSASKDVGELPSKKRRRARSTGQYVSTGRPRGRPRKHPLPVSGHGHEAVSHKEERYDARKSVAAKHADVLLDTEYDGGAYGGEEDDDILDGPESRYREDDGDREDDGHGGQDPYHGGVARDKTSRFRGVSWDPQKGSFKARVYHSGRELCVGHFSTEDEAARARDLAAVRIQGNYAKLNFSLEDEVERSAEGKWPVSRFRGVSWHPSGARAGLWRVRLFNEGHDATVGYYKTEEEAARAYDVAVRNQRGPLGKLNFPTAEEEEEEAGDEEEERGLAAAFAASPATVGEPRAPGLSPATQKTYDGGLLSTPSVNGHLSVKRLSEDDGDSPASIGFPTARRTSTAAREEFVSGIKRKFSDTNDEGFDSDGAGEEEDLSDDAAGRTLMLLASLA